MGEVLHQAKFHFVSPKPKILILYPYQRWNIKNKILLNK